MRKFYLLFFLFLDSLWLLNSISFILFNYFFGYTCSICKLLSQGLNLSHSCASFNQTQPTVPWLELPEFNFKCILFTGNFPFVNYLLTLVLNFLFFILNCVSSILPGFQYFISYFVTLHPLTRLFVVPLNMCFLFAL